MFLNGSWELEYHSDFSEYEVYQAYLKKNPSKSQYIGQGKSGQRSSHILTAKSNCLELRDVPNSEIGIRILLQSSKEIVIFAEGRLLSNIRSKFNRNDGSGLITEHIEYLGKEFIKYIDTFVSRVKSGFHLNIEPVFYDKADTVYYRLLSYPDLSLTLFSRNTCSSDLRVIGSKSKQKSFSLAFRNNELSDCALKEDLDACWNLSPVLYERVKKLINS